MLKNTLKRFKYLILRHVHGYPIYYPIATPTTPAPEEIRAIYMMIASGGARPATRALCASFGVGTIAILILYRLHLKYESKGNEE